MAKHDKRNHVLFYAFAGLSDIAKQILCQVAAFSAQVNFQTLSIFNPFLPPPPPTPALPPYRWFRNFVILHLDLPRWLFCAIGILPDCYIARRGELNFFVRGI